MPTHCTITRVGFIIIIIIIVIIVIIVNVIIVFIIVIIIIVIVIVTVVIIYLYLFIFSSLVQAITCWPSTAGVPSSRLSLHDVVFVVDETESG